MRRSLQMAKRIIKRRTDSTKKPEDKFKEVKPTEIELTAPEEKYIVTLDSEETKFLVTFKNEQVIQCMALDGTYETITIPVSQFNRGKYTFEFEEGGISTKHTSKISVFIQND
jgi:hypothetical protein